MSTERMKSKSAQTSTQPELYPLSYEYKVGFDEIRQHVAHYCSSSLGRAEVESLKASTDYQELNQAFEEVREAQTIRQRGQVLPALTITDCRTALLGIRPERTYLEESDLQELRHMLSSLHGWHKFFVQDMTSGSASNETLEYHYPTLSRYWVDAPIFPKIEQSLTQLFDLEGRIKDTASRELLRIRRELRETERSLSGTLQRIMRMARAEGWVESDVQPAMRDGRLVIPLAPEHKRKIRGIVHDESATGKTIFVEPVELVEANNRIRELEGEERREIIRILIEIANRLRPNISHLCRAYDLLAHMDFVLAKVRWAEEMDAVCPALLPHPHLEWYEARHPLLLRTLRTSGREVIPLDIKLDAQDGRILIISGPNAGGKSVCLKTVGLLQYMAQCGLPLPISPEARVGIFTHFFIDIGDEQSLEDDLSTYSSHLTNMKHIERYASSSALILIDEFGGGTEPTIGGAIAEALLERFNTEGAFGVITTHYQNLKTYAENTPGLVNGAMLYDRHLMRPLFKLSIGRPGSSFAIEIARKIGLPESVIARATEQVGSHYVDMDKYLQDIVRDKRYWEGKRQSIRQEEKRLQEAAEQYAKSITTTEQARREILAQARKEAKHLIQEANSRIERTIREIREAEAERHRTQSIRAELRDYQEQLDTTTEDAEVAEHTRREVEKLLRRRERKQKGSAQERKHAEEVALKALRATTKQTSQPQEHHKVTLQVGDPVCIDGQNSIATIISINEREAVVALGVMKLSVAPSKLRPVSATQTKANKSLQTARPTSGTKSIIDQIHDKRLSFRTDLDVRGMRVQEAVDAVTYFVDDALQLGISRLRVLHGTGTGALREAIREYLSSVRSVRRFADEHVQLGGAGITVIDLD